MESSSQGFILQVIVQRNRVHCYLTLNFYPFPSYKPEVILKAFVVGVIPGTDHLLSIYDKQVLLVLGYFISFAVMQTQFGTRGLRCTLRKGLQKPKLSILGLPAR